MATWASEDQDSETGMRAKRGGKLNRSETVTVRLDPRLNYLCELAARAQRRTKSSFIEWAVEAALHSVRVPGTAGAGWGEKSEDCTIEKLASKLWDVDEADRLAALAFHAPILMTHEEQLLWKVVKEYGYVWRGSWGSRTYGALYEEWTWEIEQGSLVMDRLRERFDTLKKVASGEAPVSALPEYEKRRKVTAAPSGAADDLDDDIPF